VAPAATCNAPLPDLGAVEAGCSAPAARRVVPSGLEGDRAAACSAHRLQGSPAGSNALVERLAEFNAQAAHRAGFSALVTWPASSGQAARREGFSSRMQLPVAGSRAPVARRAGCSFPEVG
jgi:hypothetical protein